MAGAPALTLIEGGTLYTPQPAGRGALLLGGGTILAVGEVDGAALRATGLPCDVLDARGCLVVPGLLDPHEHIAGAGGEQGFASRTPEIQWEEIALAGVTTVVGCLGTDTTTRTMAGLLGKARQLDEQGITTYLYTGGFPVPPPTLTGSVTNDLVLIDKVIGRGEVAIADTRSVEPTLQELSRCASEALVGGLLAGKAGVTHLHVGPGQARLALVRQLLATAELPPTALYPTHITRSKELLAEAIDLARRGCYVDTDTIEEGIEDWVARYRAQDGPMDRLTLSSDAHTPGGSPARLHAVVAACVRRRGLALEEVLPCVTANPAAALKLPRKGRLEAGMDADVAVLDEATLEVVHVFGRGRPLVRDGRPVCPAQEQEQG